MIKFCNLKDNIRICEGVELILETKRKKKERSGINNLKDLKWYQYVIKDNNNPYMVYDRVLVLPYCINKEIFDDAKIRVLKDKVSTAERPHVDFNTGNIHPVKGINGAINNYEVQQLILARGSYNKKDGKYNKHCMPKHPRKLESSNCCYVYSIEGNSIYVPKGCYYPLIETDKDLENDMAHILLEKIWRVLENDFK